MSVSKNSIEKIGLRACLGEILGQTYSIYACAGTFHTRYLISLCTAAPPTIQKKGALPESLLEGRGRLCTDCISSVHGIF